MRKLLCLALLAITACTHTVYRDRTVDVFKPVPQPCAGERPARPAALKDTTPDWNTLDVRQKAAVVARQGLEWQTYGEQLDAATAACP
jgi:hypothetical protein